MKKFIQMKTAIPAKRVERAKEVDFMNAWLIKRCDVANRRKQVAPIALTLGGAVFLVFAAIMGEFMTRINPFTVKFRGRSYGSRGPFTGLRSSK